MDTIPCDDAGLPATMLVPSLYRLLTTSSLLLTGGAVALALGSTPALAADPVVFEYTTCKDGLCPSGSPAWLRATITDVIVGQVTLKLESLLNSAGEHFQSTSENPNNPVGIAFNFTDPLPAPLSGFCVNTKGNGCLLAPPPGAPTFAVNSNGVDLPGDEFKGFDLALFLAPPPTPAADNRFDKDDVITYTFFATDLTASKFLATNDGGSYCSAAKVGGLANGESTVIGARCGGGSEKVPAPLPILGASMAFGFSRRLRRRVRGSGASPQASIS